MAQLSSEDEVRLQSMLRQLLQSVKEKITGAPSLECAEEILLHLEETDENFHNYEFVKYLRQYINSTLGAMIEEEMEKCTSDQNQDEGPGYDTLVQHVTKVTQESKEYKEMMYSLKNVMMIVVESLINKFEEDQIQNKEMQKKTVKEKCSNYCTDSCSDSDSSFNQSYKFSQGKLQLLLEQLDPGQPKEVRFEAMQTLCSAPPSDVLNYENWTTLCEKLTVCLADPDPAFNDRILKFYAQTFTLSPLHMTKEIYTSLARHLELYFLSGENHIPTLLTGVDVTHPNVIRLLKKVRLLNEYQKEVPSFWIRHPEKYMEEIVESTLSLLSIKHDQSLLVSQKILDPIYFLALLDIKAVWFKKWMHAHYSRTVVLQLLEKKYKSLVTTSVQQCVQYFESCENMRSDENLIHPKHCGNKQKTFYSGQELQYICFVHSLCLLGRLLIYTQGRKLFPVKLNNRKDSVSLTDLLVLFTRLIYYSPSCPKMTVTAHAEDYSPASLVTEVLRILCDQKEYATECLFKSPVIDAFLEPINNLMKETEAAPNCSEMALIHVADILARIASVEEGLFLLLYGENMNSSKDENMAWEENLLDDLLNFAATPRGLLLLQKTGSINDCVTFMFNRYAKKLQVSRHKMFGYGVVITQVASTAAGAVALRNSGFINTLVTELWAILECGRDDVRVTHPRSTPVDPIDQSCQKSFLALINLLSYPAVYELIGNQDIPNKSEYSLREVPTCIIDIIDRLIILNSEAKIRSLFNYEQSHIFGLRLLNILCCDLDTLLLLESQYQVSAMLLNAQEENVLEIAGDHRDFIIDGLSVERNHVLVRINLIGGPLERILPPRTLQKGNDPYPWPMFSSCPLPNCYLSEVTNRVDPKQDNDIGKLLSSFKISDKQAECIENCRIQFCQTMRTNPSIISGTVLAELLEKFVLDLAENPSDCYFPTVEYKATDANVKNESLSSVQQLGIKMTVRYGKFLNLLNDGAENDLTLVLKHSERFLKQQQATIKSTLRCLQGRYPGHDWFVSSLFLIMLGDKEKTLTFLQKFSRLLTSAFLWLPRLHSSKYLPTDISESGIHPIYFCGAHYIEMLLKTEVPLVFSAFHMSGFTPSQICQQWISQCFWNYLDWIEICHYIATCVFLGPDYQIYICICILKHFQQDILKHTQSQDLQIFLKEEALHGFRVSDYFEYMENLEQNYRPMLLQDMKSIRVQST
ncbi:protein broad-minded isoform X2 [Petaurus breviceps papuanus]|uniref:protein broad-minded isoform X2 n=1 Tax=Petaurus breviceps papuanus TaxID=3040969 RepID=UPI0036DC8D26